MGWPESLSISRLLREKQNKKYDQYQRRNLTDALELTSFNSAQHTSQSQVCFLSRATIRSTFSLWQCVTSLIDSFHYTIERDSAHDGNLVSAAPATPNSSPVRYLIPLSSLTGAARRKQLFWFLSSTNTNCLRKTSAFKWLKYFTAMHKQRFPHTQHFCGGTIAQPDAASSLCSTDWDKESDGLTLSAACQWSNKAPASARRWGCHRWSRTGTPPGTASRHLKQNKPIKKKMEVIQCNENLFVFTVRSFLWFNFCFSKQGVDLTIIWCWSNLNDCFLQFFMQLI